MDNRAVLLSAIVALLAIVLYHFVMGARVGTMRARLNIKAPATTGHSEFERSFRAHANTGEQYVAFIPALWLATALFHVHYWVPAGFGALFLVGRVFYMRLYMSNPEGGLPGAFLSMISILCLTVGALIGLAQNWSAAF